MADTDKYRMVPKSANGRVDWLAYIRTTWPLAIAAATVVFYFGGRLQSVQEKRQQNDIWDRPWRLRVERCESDIRNIEIREQAHQNLDGHPVMRAEYRVLLDRLQQLETRIERQRHLSKSSTTPKP